MIYKIKGFGLHILQDIGWQALAHASKTLRFFLKGKRDGTCAGMGT